MFFRTIPSTLREVSTVKVCAPHRAVNDQDSGRVSMLPMTIAQAKGVMDIISHTSLPSCHFVSFARCPFSDPELYYNSVKPGP